MSINNASYWLLFFAMSRNQESYFSRLKQDMAVGGVVLNAKHPGWGGRFSALVWLLRRRHLWSQWLFFRVQKGRLNGQKAGKLFRFGLILRSTGCLAAVQSLCKSRAPDGIVLMNGAHYKQQIVLAYIREQGVQPLYMELGCLPDTTAIDGKGVNYNGAVPRDPCFYRGYHPSKDVDATLIKRPPRKPVGEPVDLPARYIFVPFQVYDDTQILLHSPWVDSMESLYWALERCVSSLPEGWCFIVKEHPSARKSYEHIHDNHSRIVFANANDTQELIEGARLVITINSTVGIESLLLGRPVLTLGNAFYNIPELVSHAASEEQLSQLIASPESWVYDEELVRHFVAWLSEQYLVPGRFRSYRDEHPKRMKQRIGEILEGSQW
ncbi:MAG: polysaccharide synthesis/modification protein [Alcanivorax sp.]|uniref:capsular polysaccharide export protein, LipB/KpsS family n=1 Tax=unclassified Alcanivorax TaxID=2638842 RepID=UPI000789E529|nr:MULTISPECIES: polysaccharide synthesis/modification protein [unclassified Alcanivorax]MBB11200.1 polysaccharide synthesis/modification protein [Alcanivorax sp.]MBU85546.1 polysaccharide synthesis/modification protein [Alcanivorax sp.]MEE2603108.1 polysaccharide synthesis/modification protein [Pseudomonadota bacterium]|tara:strand:+ start:1510 stop:2652 length:1143 start_codon:yes stop_codon:yes gene_type:complete